MEDLIEKHNFIKSIHKLYQSSVRGECIAFANWLSYQKNDSRLTIEQLWEIYVKEVK